MLAQGGEGGRAIVRNTRFACRFGAVGYELATSLETAHYMCDLAATYTQ